MGGILNSTQSFMGVILAHFLYGKADRMTPRKAIGCALGFSGVLVATLGNHGSGSPAGVAYMLIASVIFALAGPWNKAVTQKVDSFTVSCLNLGVGGAALLVIGLVLGGSLHPQSFGAVPVLLFLAFISGAGYVIWALLMKNNPVSRIAVFGLIIPIMNVLLSAILNGEPLFEWQYLAALVLVCGGIYLVNRPNGKLEVGVRSWFRWQQSRRYGQKAKLLPFASFTCMSSLHGNRKNMCWQSRFYAAAPALGPMLWKQAVPSAGKSSWPRTISHSKNVQRHCTGLNCCMKPDIFHRQNILPSKKTARS